MLEPDGTNLKWVIIHVPLDVVRIWGSRGMLKVKGEINGFAFRTSLFPTGKGGHTLLVNKRMQAGAKAVAGTTAQFRLEPDTEKRTVTVPPELQRILNEDRAFRRWFEKLNDSTRKWGYGLDHERQERRGSPPPRRTGRRTIAIHDGSRTGIATGPAT